MRKKLNITEGIFPMPVLMVTTYNEDGSVNVMNAAWGTMQERGHVALNLTESHKTVQNIKSRGAFTVSIADADHLVEADYFGVESGNRVPDKFARSGLTASKAEAVDAPGAVRAVGNVLHRNPIQVIIHCHRVIDSRGRLSGYALGVGIKRRLLCMEGALPNELIFDS